MDEIQIIGLIRRGESEDVEFKQSFRSGEDVSKTLCSFANTRGGILIFGVKNDGQVIGIERGADEFQQKISAANQSIITVPSISMETHMVNGTPILVVIVQRAIDNSFHTFQGAVWVREGSINRRLEGQSQLDFLRHRQLLSFDEIFSDAVLSDISETKVRSYLDVRHQSNYLNSHSINDFLISSKLATGVGVLRIKNAGILCFAERPEIFIPQSEVNLVRFDGSEPISILDHQLIRGDVASLIEGAASFVKKHIMKGVQVKLSARREEIYEYPLAVIREAIVNAVTHRDYFLKGAVQISIFDDRIEFTSPGSLPNGLPRELLGTISVPRNPITYRILRDLGYVEGLATGIPKMKNDMRKKGLSDPEFVIAESVFRVVLYNKPGKRKPIESISDLNERQRKCLDYLKKNKSIKSKTYAELNRISLPMAIIDLNELVQFNYVSKVGKYRGAYYVLKTD
jgi:ATP-dependent DNA helicase RecG